MLVIMLKNVKMPTTFVIILTFISIIDATSESMNAKKVFIFQHFRLCAQFELNALS